MKQARLQASVQRDMLYLRERAGTCSASMHPAHPPGAAIALY